MLYGGRRLYRRDACVYSLRAAAVARKPGYYALTEEVDGRERVGARGGPNQIVGRSLFDEGGAPVHDVLRRTGDAEAEHRRRDEADRLAVSPFCCARRGRGEVLPAPARTRLQQVGRELGPVEHQLPRQRCSSAASRSSADRDPHAGRDIHGIWGAMRLLAPSGYVPTGHRVVLGREKERQHTVRQFPP